MMEVRNNNGTEMVLNNHFNIVEVNDNYTLVFDTRTETYIFLTLMDKTNDLYKTNIKSKGINKLRNGNYILTIRSKNYIYNPNEDYMIGDFHDKIYEYEMYENNYVLCNVDYVSYKGKYASIESITNYEGQYLGNCYNKFTNEYYNPNEEHIYNLVKNYKTKLKALKNK